MIINVGLIFQLCCSGFIVTFTTEVIAELEIVFFCVVTLRLLQCRSCNLNLRFRF